MAEERPLSYHLQELKADLQQFINTRYELLRTEMKEIAGRVSRAATLLGAGAVLGFVGLILLGACLSLWFATFFGTTLQGQYGLIYGFLIIGAAVVAIAGILASAGMGRLRSKELTPSRTLHVLRKDQAMIERQQRQEREGGQHGDEPPLRRGA